MAKKWLQWCDEILELTKEKDDQAFTEQLLKVLNKMRKIKEEKEILV